MLVLHFIRLRLCSVFRIWQLGSVTCDILTKMGACNAISVWPQNTKHTVQALFDHPCHTTHRQTREHFNVIATLRYNADILRTNDDQCAAHKSITSQHTAFRIQ